MRTIKAAKGASTIPVPMSKTTFRATMKWVNLAAAASIDLLTGTL